MNITETFHRYVLPTYGRFPLVPVRGSGSYLWDENGKKYLDFCMGIAVCSLGHCHPVLTEAIKLQVDQLMHSSNLYQIPQQATLAKTIVEDHVKIPGKVFFSNSGAEANDGLIKSARRFGHRKPQQNGEPRYEVITFKQSFHGRTLGSMAATGQAKIHEGFNPMLPGFRYCPFNDLEALTAAISPMTAAILLEPIQGEGGIHCATPEFLRGIAALCKKHDLLLFFDEVQAGFGRCGHSMAWRAFAPEIEPDGISWAKGMGGGFPIGSFWLSDRVIDDKVTSLSSLMNPGSHGSTYGGNPLACTASLAVLDFILQHNLGAHSLKMEAYIRDVFSTWQQDILTDIRGVGLLLGFAINSEKIVATGGKTSAQLLVAALMGRGLLTVAAGPETLRWLPALTVSKEEIDQALTILHETIQSLPSQ
jgi:acetylornithine/N-succinyldiaminopimelate aminotransferase